MASIRLYKEFFLISGDNIRTLINPVGLSASTFVLSSSTVIETVEPINESTGIFYVDLNSVLYSQGVIYEADWSVQYDGVGPVRILPTRFQVVFNNVIMGGTGIEIEIMEKGSIEIQLRSKPIQIEIIK